MMTNLFSMFDPSNFMMKSTWMIPILTISMPTMMNTSKTNSMSKKMQSMLKKEFKNTTKSNISNIILIPTFMSILILNLMSMIPSTMAITAQMSIIMPISLSLWMMSVIFFIIKMPNKFMSHLVPMGTPNMLIPMMVLIEMSSNMIRPITLSVRLMANIMAGHLMMHLLNHMSCSMLTSLMFPIMMLISMMLNLLEMSVAFIQSYIMCTLIALFSSEIN